MVAEPYDDDLMQDEEQPVAAEESTLPWTIILVLGFILQIVTVALAWMELDIYKTL